MKQQILSALLAAALCAGTAPAALAAQTASAAAVSESAAANRRADLDTLMTTLERVHPNLYANTPKAAFETKRAEIEADLNGYVNRMLAHEPLPYILGQWDFYGISLEVTPDVLIPRDDTMAVTDLALEVLRTGHPSPRVLDLCCGSGCIGLAIAHQLPDAHVTLADISRPALAVAKRNIKRLKLMNRVTAIGLDAKKPAPSFVGTLDALVCNPPYVTAEEMTQLEPSVRDYEPALALDGGADGLDFYRAVAENFTRLIASGGYLCFEFGLGQHVAVSMILQEYGYTDIVLRKDLRGVIRAARGTKK